MQQPTLVPALLEILNHTRAVGGRQRRNPDGGGGILTELERCIVQPKNPPGILAIRCGLAYGGSNAIFTHCSLPGFYTGVEETPFASAYIDLTNSVFDCLNEDVRSENGNLTVRYSYAAKLHHPAPTVVHPVPGPVPGLWDSAQGDVHLLPLANGLLVAAEQPLTVLVGALGQARGTARR
jgi:hypothetical protein